MNEKETTKKKINASELILGCDLGTTNSCVAISLTGDEANVVINEMGQRTTPSVVSFSYKNGKEEIKVGQTAKNEMIINSSGTIFEAKRLIGRNYNDPEVQEFKKNCPYNIVNGPEGDARIKVGENVYSPVKIGSEILRKMKQYVDDYLGVEREKGEKGVTKAVVTVPAYFNDAQRQATKDAGRIAELEVVRIINEPTAAALAYGIDKKGGKSENIAVFDLGGGTFDISIITINEGIFEVKATNGNTCLGGVDFDQVIMNKLISTAKTKLGIDVSKNAISLQRLKEAAENTKKELSFTKISTINLTFIEGKDKEGKDTAKNLLESITRDDFEDSVKHLLDKLEEPCKKCLKDAGVKTIEEVILVGGMTRMPAVQKKVRQIFGKEPNKSVNPDEAVAIGAALQGSVLAGKTKDVLLLDVVPLSLGIETEHGIKVDLIPRNTTVPFKKKQIFSTAVDNQSEVQIRIAEGESPNFNSPANHILGTFTLTDIKKGALKGEPQIEVEFSVDSNSILTVSAEDLSVHKPSKMTISGNVKLSEEEIKKMLEEAKNREKEDEEFKSNVELINSAENYCYTFEKQLNEFRKNNLENETQFKELDKLYQDLKDSLKERDYPKLRQQIDKIDELMKLTNELTQKMAKDKTPPSKDEGYSSQAEEVEPEDQNNKNK